MNVYLRIEEGLELVGHTSLPEVEDDEYVVDVEAAGTGEVRRLAYVLRSVPCMAPDGHAGMERAVLLPSGQPPEFLPGWEPVDFDG